MSEPLRREYRRVQAICGRPGRRWQRAGVPHLERRGTVKLSVLGGGLASLLVYSGVENVQKAVDPPPTRGWVWAWPPIGAQVTVVAPTGLS